MALRPQGNRQSDARPVETRAGELAAGLPPLMIEADQVARTVAQGVHGRRRTGPGESFWQYRRFREGDAAHAIDWRRSARSEHLFVRETEWEAAQSGFVWCDTSASMQFASSAGLPSKADRALVLSLALMSLLLEAGEQVAVVGSGRWPTGGRLAFDQLALDLIHGPAEASPAGKLPIALDLPRHAQLVLVSDFLTDPAAVEQLLAQVAGIGVSAHLVQVLDPAEETLPYEGRTEFEGMEGDMRLIFGRVEAVRDAYRQRLAAHREALSRAASRFGFTFSHHRTDHPPQIALLALYGALAGSADRRAGAGQG